MVSIMVFLGNPGKQYALTRHNFGWIICDKFTEHLETVWTGKFSGLVSEVRIQGKKVILLKPLIYMNRSGQSVGAAVRFYKIPPEEVLVIHDDLELVFGRIEIKFGGGAAGHNGLRSIKEHLGTDTFHRLRLGIGRPERMDVSSYVLSRFSKEEEKLLPELSEHARDLLMESVDP